MPGIQIPVTSSSNLPVVVPDHFRLADAIQMSFEQLGNGFFIFNGYTVNGTPFVQLNGQAVPGTGLNVNVLPTICLIKGSALSGKNKTQFDPTKFTSIAVPADGNTHYIVVSPPTVTGTDGFNRPDIQAGVLSLQSALPTPGSGSLDVAAVTVPIMPIR
jgi:hypothetical protein